jgi:type IV secretion system protein VirB6
MNWSIFQSMFEGIEQPILDKVNGISDSLLGAVSGPLHAALIIYIALIGVMIVSGKMNEPLRDTWGRIARGAAIAGFLTAGTYNQYTPLTR